MTTTHDSSEQARRPAPLTRLTIARKLLINAVLPVLLFGLFSVWLWAMLGGMRDRLQNDITTRIEHALLGKDLQRNVVQVQQYLSDVSATRALDGLDDGFAEAQKNREAFLLGLSRFRTQAQRDGDAARLQRVDDLGSRFDAYYKAGVEMARAYVDGGPQAGNARMPAFDQVSLDLQKNLDAFVAAEVDAARQSVQAGSDQAQLVRWLALAVCVGTCLAVLWLSWVLARSIVRPLSVAAHVAHRIAGGDLSHHFMPKGTDEVAQMLASMGTMQQSLRALVHDIGMAAGTVNSASDEIARANVDLSERTERQAAALQQTAASMEHIGASERHSAERAATAQQRAQSASAMADQGGQSVQEMVRTMHSIDESARRIGDIIGVIDGIAFQTNILALNAAVEAARAGEHGRGFAVVASEVRSLASRAASAAREIKQLIDESGQRSAQGSTVAERAGSTIGGVVSAVQQVRDLITEVCTASQAQNERVHEIGGAISEMDRSTQQNAALVEQTAAAATSLAAQARQLTETMARFKLG